MQPPQEREYTPFSFHPFLPLEEGEQRKCFFSFATLPSFPSSLILSQTNVGIRKREQRPP
jgi:hypothetical protein